MKIFFETKGKFIILLVAVCQLLITYCSKQPGIYIGNNKFIHTSSKNGVTITSLNDPWWNEKFIFGTRVFD